MPIGKRDISNTTASEEEMCVLSKTLPHKCDMCGEGFDSKAGVAAHIRLHWCLEAKDAQLLKERGVGNIIDTERNEGGGRFTV